MIEVRHVSKYYGAHAAVTELTFAVPQGEVVGLLGLNGAGKTTTLRILSGLLVPTSGAVYIGGVNMADDPEGVRGRIGFLPEQPPLYAEMTVRRFLRFVGRINGVRAGLDAAIDAALGATDLLGVQHERIAMLSDGTQRRVGIAQTIVHSPHLILLDEPTQGLDPVQVAHMRQLIGGLRGRHTVLLSSHMLGEIDALCDRILVLDEGRIVAEGSAQALAQAALPVAHATLELRAELAVARTLAQRFATVDVAEQKADEAGPYAHLRLRLAAADRSALAAACHAAGLPLLTLHLGAPSLEATFLALLEQRREGGRRAC